MTIFDFARAATFPYSDALYAMGATSASDDPFLPCVYPLSIHANSVWYSYEPAAPGDVMLDTLGSDYDTVLAVWTGTRGALVSEACSDDAWGGVRSALYLHVMPGTTYYFEVVRKATTTYAGTLVLHVRPLPVYLPALFGMRASAEEGRE